LRLALGAAREWPCAFYSSGAVREGRTVEDRWRIVNAGQDDSCFQPSSVLWR
jgi:hypothetical protein